MHDTASRRIPACSVTGGCMVESVRYVVMDQRRSTSMSCLAPGISPDDVGGDKTAAFNARPTCSGGLGNLCAEQQKQGDRGLSGNRVDVPCL